MLLAPCEDLSRPGLTERLDALTAEDMLDAQQNHPRYFKPMKDEGLISSIPLRMTGQK
jgi:hypothetical protein